MSKAEAGSFLDSCPPLSFKAWYALSWPSCYKAGLKPENMPHSMRFKELLLDALIC